MVCKCFLKADNGGVEFRKHQRGNGKCKRHGDGQEQKAGMGIPHICVKRAWFVEVRKEEVRPLPADLR
jgi:hypothetical protein